MNRLTQKLQSRADELDEWEPKRVARPEGMPEWGGVPAAAPAGQEAVDADLSPQSGSSFFARRRPIQAEERAPGEQETAPVPAAPRTKPPVVLGPDGKPCRACSTKLAFGAALRAARRPSTSSNDDACPPDVEELGRSTWTFLHSAAAYYPDTPSDEQRRAMQAVLDALPSVYPCSACASELRVAYEQPESNAEARARAVTSGPALRQWLCELHNGVNVRLEKPLWNCEDATRLRHRWYEPPEDKAC